MQDNIEDCIASNVGLIFVQLKKFNLARDPEAESIGYEALYNAILTYDGVKKTKLSTYASVCIYNALGTYVRTLHKQRQLEVMSYNNIAYAEDGTKHEFVDFIQAPTNIADDYQHKELCNFVCKEFQILYDNLTNEKHRAIAKIWHDSDYEASTVSIAKQVGVSQPYVSQIINSLKNSLRKRLEEYYNG